MTETIVGVIGDRPGDKRCWPSIGRVGFGYQIEIRNSQNQQVPYGETGEICVKGEPGKTLFKEYYNHPDATSRVYDTHGWLHTGDFGYVTEDGFFYFIDRSCNMIKRGGENISCTEIENIIARHPKIQDVAVIGVNDPLRDWALKAFVVVNEGEQLNENEFFLFCENTMAKFKVPAFVEFCGDLPRNCTGKIIRKYLQ